MSSALEEAIQLAYQRRREKKLPEARRRWHAAVDLARHESDRRRLIESLNGLAQSHRDLGDPAAAAPLYEEAVLLCREEADPLLLAHTVRHLGDAHRHLHRLDLARRCYEEALQIYRADRNASQLDLANALRPFAILKEQTNEPAEARQLWQEARAIYQALDIQPGIAESDRHLAALDGSEKPK